MSKIINGYKVIDGVFEAGSAVRPSFRFLNDLDTGLYSAAANTIGFAANGVSLGTWTPRLLSVVDSTTNAPNYIQIINQNAGSSAQSTFQATTDGGSFYFGAASVASGSFQGGGFIVTGNARPFQIWTNNVQRYLISSSGNHTFTQGVSTSGVPTALTLTSGAHTGLTAATEDIGVNFNMSANKTWAAGLVSVQREVVFQAPTYTTATFATAATVAITGAPTATATTSLAFWVQSGNSLFAGGLASIWSTTSYTNGVGFGQFTRTGNLTGVGGEVITDLSIIPSFTLTEPGSSLVKYYGAKIDVSGVSVTAGTGGSLLAGLYVKAGADTDATDNMAILSEGKLSIQDGHFKMSQTTAPTTTLTSTTLNDGAGSGASITMGTNATDTAGSFTVTAGNGTPTAGIAGQIVFNIAYGAAPKTVVITPRDTNGVGVQAYISARGTTSFEISFATASGTSNAQVFDYIVVE